MTPVVVEDDFVGFFSGYLFSGGGWQEWDAHGDRGAVAEPWMSLLIHDSDLAILAYRPGAAGSGVAYVGGTPRLVFDDESEPAAPDRKREAAALAHWVTAATAASAFDLPRLESVIEGFLATDDDPELDEAVDDGPRSSPS